MALSKTLTMKSALQNCVSFEILHLFMSLWDFAWVEKLGLGGAEPHQPKQSIPDFIYFKTVSFTTSDVY